ncbi:MAG: lysophospholipid acyltransferase family protein [Saccharofermentanales bacterium]
MKGSARHRFVNRFARIFLIPVLRSKLNFTFEKIEPKSRPYILVSNHVCNYDPILVGFSFKDVIYYIASDHLFRMGLVSRLLVFAISPIPRAKATTETKTVIEIFKRIKDGHNICIFAEGNSTFSGETGYIPPSIGKLAKRTGASLITYRITGGYFTLPRWSHNVRKGKMTGALVHEYTPDELKAMSDEEMNAAVARDLYVNAYEDQEKLPQAYRGDRLAEHLEYALYCCPKCLKFSTLASKDDRFRCSCGLDLRYTEYGYLEPYTPGSEPAPFTRILDWVKWQKAIVKEYAARSISDPACSGKQIFSDSGQTLIKAIRTRRNIVSGRGTVDFYCDRFTLTGDDGQVIVFKLADIVSMSIITQMNLVFSTHDGNSYELHSDHPRSASKYVDLFRDLLGRPEGV